MTQLLELEPFIVNSHFVQSWKLWNQGKMDTAIGASSLLEGDSSFNEWHFQTPSILTEQVPEC